MAKISVIIPIYNVENYLEKCLNSIINQTFKNLEILCVNDGSTDSSLQILEDFAKKDNRIKIINKKNGGLSSARNAGLEVATSEWISFIDSDDWLDLNAFEELEKFFSLNPDIICFGTHLRGDISPELASADAEYYRIKHSGFIELNDKIRETTDVATWNKLYKKAIIDKINLKFPIGRHYEDYPFYWEYVFEAKTAYYTDEKFYNYLRRPNSIMANTFNKKSDKVIDHLYAAEIIFNYCKERGILEKHLTVFAEIFMNCFWFAYNHSPKKNHKNILKSATELLNKFELGNDFNDKYNNIIYLKAGQYYKLEGLNCDKNLWQKLFSVKNKNGKKIIKILGIKLSIKHKQEYYKLSQEFCKLTQDLNDQNKELKSILEQQNVAYKEMIAYTIKTIVPYLQFAEDKEYKSNNTDPNILNELKNIGEFNFLPNLGNLGDILISYAEMQFFDTYKMKYNIADIKNLNLYDNKYNLVYGGGGIWNSLYKNVYKDFFDCFTSKYLNKCIILPSSFYDCDEVLNLFDERFIVFCREQQSLDYCISKNKKAKFILADDMAVNANLEPLQSKTLSKMSLVNYDIDINKLNILYSQYNQVINTAINQLKKIDNYYVGYLLRTDKEKAISLKNDLAIDLSSIAGSRARDNALNILLCRVFLSVIEQFEVIVTDRLHVGIAAAKLGKQVLLIDNSYKKISNVYYKSLTNFKNVKLVSEKEAEEYLSHSSTQNCLITKKKEDLLENLKLSFPEFVINYGGFKTKNRYCDEVWI